jgi:hypothetical protein
MKLRSLAPLAATALVAIGALCARALPAQGMPPSKGKAGAPMPGTEYVDGGVLRARGGVVVPKSMAEQRKEDAQYEELPFISIASPDLLAALGEFHPVVGAWAEYAVSLKGHQTTRVLISVLPPPMPDGRYWLEIDTLDESSLPMAMRILAHGNPALLANMDRALVQVAGQNLFEVPISAAPAALKAPEGPSGVKITTEHGVKTTVHAGTFRTDRLQMTKAGKKLSVWLSDEVPLFRLVRSEGDGKVAELWASGKSGAHTLLSEPVLDENLPPPAQGNGSDNK